MSSILAFLAGAILTLAVLLVIGTLFGRELRAKRRSRPVRLGSLPWSNLNIPMPAGTKPPPPSPIGRCTSCGNSVDARKCEFSPAGRYLCSICGRPTVEA